MTSGLTRDYAADSSGLVARGIAQNLVSRSCFFIFGYLASVILARAMGPAAYGVYGVIMSVLLWVEQISKFMIPPATAILIPREENHSPGLEQTALFLNLTVFITLFVLLWFAAPLLAVVFSLHDGAYLFRVAALDLPFFGMYFVYRAVFQGHGHFLSISIGELLYVSAKLAATVLLVALWVSVPGALIINVVASVCALLFALSRSSIKLGPPRPEFVGRLIQIALPLGLYMLALQTAGSLDLWFLQVLNPSKEASTIGIYVAARNVALVPGVILLVTSDVLLPSLSRAVAQNNPHLSRDYLQSGVRFLLIVVLPLLVLFMWTADEIMALLFTTSFGGGGIYLRILVFHGISLAFVDLFASALNAHGNPYISGTTLLLLIAVAVPLNVILILSFGPTGAAYASALTGLLGTALLGFLVYRRFGPVIRFRTFLNVTGAALLTVVIANQFTTTGSLLPISCVAYLVIYGIGLALVGEITRQDLEPFAVWRWR